VTNLSLFLFSKDKDGNVMSSTLLLNPPPSDDDATSVRGSKRELPVLSLKAKNQELSKRYDGQNTDAENTQSTETCCNFSNWFWPESKEKKEDTEISFNVQNIIINDGIKFYIYTLC